MEAIDVLKAVGLLVLAVVGPIYCSGVGYIIFYGVSRGWHRAFIETYKPTPKEGQ